jgi:hypothetical protein
MLEASNVLKREFPEYGEIGTRKSGMTEFRLKRIPCRVCGGDDHDATVDKVSKKKTAKKQTKQNKTQKKRGK